jgi:class 3 adenylate cyclase
MAGMSSLPRGTVTFVFTDIEESTTLLRTLGDGYGEVLSAHRAIVREAFGAEGVEIDTQGDAFFFAFPRARDAVAAAVTVQREHAAREWPDGARVRVRIGLHTGEPAVHEEGYLGLDVVRAARICTAAPGGHVLLSETTRALLGSSLPEGVSVYPLGERHLKGIDEPERIYELEIDGVETEAAPPVAAEPPAPPAPAAPKKPGEDFGERLAASIQEQVAQRLERAFEKLESLPSRAGPDDDDVDRLAARSASLEESIRARVDAALRARGLDDGTR